MNLETIVNIISSSPKDKYDTIYLLTQYYRNEGDNYMQSSLKAESNVRNFVEIVQGNINASNKHNICCLFQSISSSVTCINIDFYKVKNIFDELHNLTWQEFEDFCSGLMKKCFNASNVEVTQRTADMGLDFKGLIPLKSVYSKSPFSFIEIYGQAKKYSGNVCRRDIDAFTAFANRQKRDNTYPAQLFIFCTTSDFIPSAQDEIIKNNFVSLNGWQIATLIFNETKEEGVNAIKQFL